jgi:hypothetical protein
MKAERVRSVFFVTCLAALGGAAPACELAVQLDRSAVDGGGDEGCPICADGGASGDTADAGEGGDP